MSESKKLFGEAFLYFVTTLFLFCGVFFVSFTLLKNNLYLKSVDIPLIKSGFDANGLNMVLLIKKKALLIGGIIGVVFSLFLLFLMLIFTTFRRKSYYANMILFSIILVLFGFLAFDLVYLEPRFTALGSSIKSFIGVPFGISLLSLALLFGFWFSIRLISKGRKVMLLLLILFSFSSCSLSSFLDSACDLNPDSDHCYQQMAVQSGNANTCEKIKGESFEGQNPPKDKCYLMSAVSQGDYNLCGKIKGGLVSYSKDQCLLEVAIGKKDPEGCQKLPSEEMKSDCISRIPTIGDNPLGKDETPVASVSKIAGDVRVIKADGRVIPLTKDSVLGPNDRISSMEEGTFIIDLPGKGTFCVPQNTMLIMNSEMELLDNACAAVTSIR